MASEAQLDSSHQNRAFITLDGLRGIAALMIAARHAPIWPSGHPTRFLGESYLAVDFFFVLSGFVLAYAYGERLRTGMNTRRFMAIRLTRLYPLYFLAFLLSLGLNIDHLKYVPEGAISLFPTVLFALLFLPDPVHPSTQMFPMNGPAWSLFFELVANFFYGLAGRHLTTARCAAICAGAAAVLLIAVPSRWFGFGGGNGAMDAGTYWGTFYAGLARVTYSFFAGVLLYRLRESGRIMRVRGIPPIVVMAALIAVLGVQPQKGHGAYDLIATLALFPCLVHVGADSLPDKVSARLFSALGVMSYAVYVLQGPLFAIWTRISPLLTQDRLTGGLLGIGFLAAVALLADKVFDRPLRGFLSRPRTDREQIILSSDTPS